MRALTHLHMVRSSRFHRHENNRQNLKKQTLRPIKVTPTKGESLMTTCTKNESLMTTFQGYPRKGWEFNDDLLKEW